MSQKQKNIRKTLPISFRLPPALKTAAERAAADDLRSLSSLIELALRDYLQDRGYLAAKPAGLGKVEKREVRKR
jgi:hypothetical protein